MPRIKLKKNHWLDLVKPSEKEVLSLKKKYKFHTLDLEDCVSESQRPKIDEYDKYLFIVLQFPYYNRRTRHIATEQVNIFIGQDYLITIHDGHLDEIKQMFDTCKKSSKKKEEFFGNSTGYLLYSIVNHLFKSS